MTDDPDVSGESRSGPAVTLPPYREREEDEVVRDIKPLIGYVHTGIEKSCEDQEYWKAIPFVERMDYLSYYFNARAYCIEPRRPVHDGLSRPQRHIRTTSTPRPPRKTVD